MPTSPVWPKERVEKFKQLKALGWSAGLIAAELGLTRNAVIGKSHRLGLRDKQLPGVHVCKQRKNYERRRAETKVEPPPKPPVLVAPPLQVPPPPPVSLNPKRLVDLEPGDCRFPISPHFSTDFWFCGNPVQQGCSYCYGHNWIAHQHVPGRKAQPVRLPSLFVGHR